MCQLTENVRETINYATHHPKSLHTIQRVAEQERIKGVALILEALSVEEIAEFMFKKFPSKGVLKALSVLIGRAENMQDLKDAQKHASVFGSVSDCSPVSDTTKITIDLHGLIDDVETFIELSTSEDSENGALISHDEATVILKLIANMDKLQSDLSMFVHNRSVYDGNS